PVDRAHRPCADAGHRPAGLSRRGAGDRRRRAGDGDRRRGGDRRLPGKRAPMTLLGVESLDVRHGLLQAVRPGSLTLGEGEPVALVGANGAGKTTLLRTIAGAHRPAAGRILFDGAEITGMPAHRRVRLGIALVPEGRRLFPGLTVEENLLTAGARGRPG